MTAIDLTIPASLDRTNNLPAMVDRAAKTLAGAHNAAEVLEARDMASVAYDMAKRAARLKQAKGAHDELLSKINRAQADALEIEARAKRRLADEYDAAQDRGEINKAGGDVGSKIPERNFDLTGVSNKDIHEARMIRDAEVAEPGIVKNTIKEALDAGEEPTRAKVRRAVLKTAKKKKKPKKRAVEMQESQHDRDLRMLFGVWEAACETARIEFRNTINQ